MQTFGRTILLGGASISMVAVTVCIATVCPRPANAVPEEIAANDGPELPEAPDAQAPVRFELLQDIESFATSMTFRGPVSFYYIDDLAIREPESGRLTDRGFILREWSGVVAAGPLDAWVVNPPADLQIRLAPDDICLTPGR